MSSTEVLSAAIESTLSQHLDEDTCSYIESMLAGDDDEDDQTKSNSWSDPDKREAIQALIEGSDLEGDSDLILNSFFELLDEYINTNAESQHKSTNSNIKTKSSTASDENADVPLRKLSKSITIKDSDIQTFAMGLVAADTDDHDKSKSLAGTITNTSEAYSESTIMSERKRRKERQKKLRLELQEKERQRAIQDAITLINNNEGDDDNENDPFAHLLQATDDSADINVDVHFRNFDLHNARFNETNSSPGRGGGDLLLTNANLTLSSNRRYGLMGRNGCGKTTFLKAIANRTFPKAVPKNMSMLLVQQEIVGGDLTALETVLKSDIKREAMKRYIQLLEQELERLDNPTNATEEDATSTLHNESVIKEHEASTSTSKSNVKNKRDRRERKRDAIKSKKTTKQLAKSKQKKILSPEEVAQRKHDITDKLSLAYQKLVQVEDHNGINPEGRARRLLSGLGFSPELQDKPTKELSGGWRMRVALTCALFSEPTLLLLDEPTNHLDLEAVLWLERWLNTKFKGTLVVVSHDRHFLNEVVTDVVHFYRNQLTTYRGDIDNYITVVEENKKRQLRLREVQEAKREHLQKYIDLHAQSGENGVKAAKQRKSRMKKLDKLGVMQHEGRRFKASYDGPAEEVEEYKEDDKVTLIFPDPGGFDGDILRLEQVDFGYTPNKILLQNIDMAIDSKSRVALLGRNGCGKSTLIKLIIGELNAIKGKVSINGRAKIEYLAQHQLEQLDPDGNPLQTMLERYPKDKSNAHILELRRYLANFGLGGEVLPNQKISTMSGGQKCRLCLAAAMYRKPHILILDEPTNHLDLETTEALIEAIKSYHGGVLLVSHDQHLLTSVCKDLFVVENGNVTKLRHGTTNGETFEAYKKAIVQGRR